jgi:hypothetical protein
MVEHGRRATLDIPVGLWRDRFFPAQGGETPMKVDTVLAKKAHAVATVNPSATLATVAQRLRLEGIGRYIGVRFFTLK